MFPHKDGRVGVMKQIGGQMRKFRKHLSGHIGVTLCRDEQA